MSNPRKALGTALEHRIVELAQEKGLKAHRQPGSGVFKAFPHDATIEDILVEAKVRSTGLDARGQKTITLSLDWLDKVQKAAKQDGYRAGVVIARPKNSARLLVLVEADFFLDLLLTERGKGATIDESRTASAAPGTP